MVTGGLTQSSPSSGIFFQGDGQSHNVNSYLSSSFGNSSNTLPVTGCSNLGPVSGDMNNAVLNSVANSAPSVGASSLVTDANSALSGGPHLQRSASINTDSYLRLPASPMSFTSNNISISGSSVMDGSSIVQQNSHQGQSVQQFQPNQQRPQVASSATSLPVSQPGPSPLPMGAPLPESLIQDPNNVSHVSKKPRLDIKQDDTMQQQVMQQFLQRQDPMQFQSRNPQLQALLQQQQILKQQQMFQSMPQLQRAQLQQQQQHQQMHLRQQLQQPVMQPTPGVKHPYEAAVNGVCARRLMQYLYHQRQRPSDNSIAYWRKFVAEYYSPRAKKRWCLSLYNNVGHQALGVFPQAAMDAWQCDICCSKSGRGFEGTFEVLPRLNEIKFRSGVIDELLFVDMPRERRFPNGIMMLEYAKAVQESVYEQLRIVREGHLRIIFTQDLKILSWEFCARRHEELLPRRLVAPQVNQLLQVAQKCQSTIAESGSDGVSHQDLQTNSNMVMAAGRQLAKSLELQSLNELGFSKRYVRFLQISEVVNCMKDLIDISGEHKVGPIECLKNYPRFANAVKLQKQKMQEMEQIANAQGLPTDRNTLNKLMALNRGALSGLTNYQNILMRQNSMNSSPASLQRDGSPSFNNSNQNPSSALQGAATALIPGSMQNSPVRGLPSPHLPPLQQQQQQHLQQGSSNANSALQQNHSQGSQGHQALQQQMIQQLLKMSGNNGGAQLQSLGGPNANGSVANNGFGLGGHSPSITGRPISVSGNNGPVSRSNSFKGASNSGSPAAGGNNVSVSGNNGPVSRSNSFKGASNSDSPSVGGNNGFNQRISDVPQNLPLQDGVPDIAQDFTDNPFFNSDLDDDMVFGWKA